MGTIDLPKKRQHKIVLNTGDNFSTGIIDGHLDAVIIDSIEQVSVTINSNLGYLIFHNSQHKGVNYYAPRALLQGAMANIIVHDQFEKFKLNEGLDIRVDGPTNAKVTIILRFN